MQTTATMRRTALRTAVAAASLFVGMPAFAQYGVWDHTIQMQRRVDLMRDSISRQANRSSSGGIPGTVFRNSLFTFSIPPGFEEVEELPDRVTLVSPAGKGMILVTDHGPSVVNCATSHASMGPSFFATPADAMFWLQINGPDFSFQWDTVVLASDFRKLGSPQQVAVTTICSKSRLLTIHTLGPEAGARRLSDFILNSLRF
jgi:hypothetical protein